MISSRPLPIVFPGRPRLQQASNPDPIVNSTAIRKARRSPSSRTGNTREAYPGFSRAQAIVQAGRTNPLPTTGPAGARPDSRPRRPIRRQKRQPQRLRSQASARSLLTTRVAIYSPFNILRHLSSRPTLGGFRPGEDKLSGPIAEVPSVCHPVARLYRSPSWPIRPARLRHVSPTACRASSTTLGGAASPWLWGGRSARVVVGCQPVSASMAAKPAT